MKNSCFLVVGLDLCVRRKWDDTRDFCEDHIVPCQSARLVILGLDYTSIAAKFRKIEASGLKISTHYID